jgi:hypothetical protein
MDNECDSSGAGVLPAVFVRIFKHKFAGETHCSAQDKRQRPETTGNSKQLKYQAQEGARIHARRTE